MRQKLTELCDILYGFAFDSAGFTEDSTYPPLVRIRDVKRGYSETNYSGDYQEQYVIHAGDLLIGMDGEFNIARWKSRDALLNQRVCKISAKEGTEEEYLRFALSRALREIENRTAFVTVKHLSAKELNKLELQVPSLSEQNRIAITLRRIEQLIDLRNEELKKLDELIRARFIEMFGDPETKPKSWEQVTLNDVCSSIVRGPFGSALKKEFFVEPDETTYKVYEQKHAIQKSSTIGTYYVTAEKYNELKRFECCAGDILMSCSGTMGELYQLPEGCERGIINQALCKFTLNERILPIFFLVYMQQTIGDLETKGSGIKNIAAVSYVKAMPINLPPMKVQKLFATFVTQVDKSKAVIQKSLEEAQLLFDSLMQQYFG